MVQSNPKQSPQSENGNAITTLLNSELESFGVTTEVTEEENCLFITVKTPQSKASKPIIQKIQEALNTVPLDPSQKILISWKIGEHSPAWEQELELTKMSISAKTAPPLWQSIKQKITNVGQTVGNTASNVGEAISKTTSETAKAVTNTASGLGEHFTQATSQTTQSLSNHVSGVGNAVKNTTFQVTKNVSYTANQVGEWLGQATTSVINNPLLERIINRVDLVKAEEALKHLQTQYPNENPRQIAHRLIVEKAIYAGSSGLASSFLPGLAAGLVALDLAAVAALQAEMIFQIGAAYGLDLKDPARKGEVLAIFGLSLGGSQALKAGLGLIRTAPGIGAVIGASTNATMMFALGYAACQFYETKLNSSVSQEELIAVQAESDRYLKDHLSQQTAMDQILVHLVLAGNPGKTWEEILPELEPLNLSPVSLKMMQEQSQSPPSVEDLLEKINEDFGVSLLAQCEKISQFDQMITPEEAVILEKIETKLKPISLNSHSA